MNGDEMIAVPFHKGRGKPHAWRVFEENPDHAPPSAKRQLQFRESDPRKHRPATGPRVYDAKVKVNDPPASDNLGSVAERAQQLTAQKREDALVRRAKTDRARETREAARGFFVDLNAIMVAEKDPPRNNISAVLETQDDVMYSGRLRVFEAKLLSSGVSPEIAEGVLEEIKSAKHMALADAAVHALGNLGMTDEFVDQATSSLRVAIKTGVGRLHGSPGVDGAMPKTQEEFDALYAEFAASKTVGDGSEEFVPGTSLFQERAVCFPRLVRSRRNKAVEAPSRG
jgi:hypothetical protein